MNTIAALFAASTSAVDPWNPTGSSQHHVSHYNSGHASHHGHGHTSYHDPYKHHQPTHTYSNSAAHHHQQHDSSAGSSHDVHSLYSRVVALKLKNETLRKELNDLEALGKLEDSAALIEDFFFVNDA